MKTQYEYIHFEKTGDGEKTSRWNCVNNRSRDVLARIMWYGAWRQYCFFPTTNSQVVFNEGCLKDILNFLEQLKEERNEQRRTD